MTSGGNRNPANPETGGWMDRMRRRRFTPTASFTHGRGTNPNGSRQVRAQCNSANTSQPGPGVAVVFGGTTVVGAPGGAVGEVMGIAGGPTLHRTCASDGLP